MNNDKLEKIIFKCQSLIGYEKYQEHMAASHSQAEVIEMLFKLGSAAMHIMSAVWRRWVEVV
jgi:hypothetical protein